MPVWTIGWGSTISARTGSITWICQAGQRVRRQPTSTSMRLARTSLSRIKHLVARGPQREPDRTWLLGPIVPEWHDQRGGCRRLPAFDGPRVTTSASCTSIKALSVALRNGGFAESLRPRVPGYHAECCG